MDNVTGVFGLPVPSVAPVSVEDEDINIIAASGLFNEEWYIRENPDVARSGINPLVHYVRHGAAEGRAPFQGFNAVRYLANVEVNGRVNRNPLAHYILHGSPEDMLLKGLLTKFSIKSVKQAMDRLAALPIFSLDDYLTLNQDIKPTGGNMDVDPLNHAVVYGFPEGRTVFMKTTVARVMGAVAAKPFPPLVMPAPLDVPPPVPVVTGAAKSRKRKGDVAAPALPAAPVAATLPVLPRIGVFYNRAGNAFIREIAEDIVQSLHGAGQDAVLLDETWPQEERPELNIFVAPHEFFHIGAGRAWAHDEVLKSAFLYTTEQPQTLWFERAMPFVLMSRGVIDIAWQVAEIFATTGIPTRFFNPNVAPRTAWLEEADMKHPLVRVLPKAAQAREVPKLRIAERLIDVSFFGTESEHREKFFTKNAGFFADYEAFLYYRKVESPLLAKGSHAALARLAGHVAAHSKLMLNIHTDNNGFFEWHRIVKLGMVSGAVVVSEPCPPHPLFKPGVHYMEESGRHILNLVEWLVRSPDGQAKAQAIQDNADKIVSNPALALDNIHGLLRFLDEHRVRA
ncbi:MAG: hypothetical protein B7Z75_08915 [Acidocella sp. 20-57-95]|nr:MAG: hypothetical protein B7Z75_08915 [Acidocella sp. 20-57-95]HQT64223.1 hypothetical protein [Acidocella sp.]HQU05266.1 hypothetical protein [Acidocella sp.]